MEEWMKSPPYPSALAVSARFIWVSQFDQACRCMTTSAVGGCSPGAGYSLASDVDLVTFLAGHRPPWTSTPAEVTSGHEGRPFYAGPIRHTGDGDSSSVPAALE